MMVEPEEPCTHRDAYGSTIVFVQDRPQDGVCLLCDERFPDREPRLFVLDSHERAVNEGEDDVSSEERDEAIDRALLYTFQLSNKDYTKMRNNRSSESFVRALEQDGYTVTKK